MRWSSISPFILNMLKARVPAFQKSKLEEHWTTELPFVGAKIGPAVLVAGWITEVGRRWKRWLCPVWRPGGD